MALLGVAACDSGAPAPAPTKPAAPQVAATVPGGRVYLPMIGNAPASAPQPAAATPATPTLAATPTAAALLRPGATATPTARTARTAPAVSPTATLVAQRIQFPAGATGTTLNGSLAPTAVNRYLINVAAKQRLTVKVAPTQGTINFSVVAADGTTQKKPDEAAPNGAWSMVMVKTQDYRITLSEAGRAAGAYTLTVSVGP